MLQWRMKPGMFAKLICGAAALALLAGCGGGGGGGGVTGPVTTPPVITPPVITPPVTTPTYPSPPASALSVSAHALTNFTAILSEDVTSIPVGGTVNYTVVLTNSSSSPQSMIADSSNGTSVPKASLRITNSAGQTVYPPPVRPLDAPPPPPSNGVAAIQPGESIFKTTALAVFSKPGTYQAVATFTVAASASDKAQTVTLPALPITVK